MHTFFTPLIIVFTTLILASVKTFLQIYSLNMFTFYTRKVWWFYIQLLTVPRSKQNWSLLRKCISSYKSLKSFNQARTHQWSIAFVSCVFWWLFFFSYVSRRLKVNKPWMDSLFINIVFFSFWMSCSFVLTNKLRTYFIVNLTHTPVHMQ